MKYDVYKQGGDRVTTVEADEIDTLLDAQGAAVATRLVQNREREAAGVRPVETVAVIPLTWMVCCVPQPAADRGEPAARN